MHPQFRNQNLTLVIEFIIVTRLEKTPLADHSREQQQQRQRQSAFGHMPQVCLPVPGEIPRLQSATDVRAHRAQPSARCTLAPEHEVHGNWVRILILAPISPSLITLASQCLLSWHLYMHGILGQFSTFNQLKSEASQKCFGFTYRTWRLVLLVASVLPSGASPRQGYIFKTWAPFKSPD